jgi:2-keto-4-pentenoate hydratase/2-oxohepta-3-ene-1,7-dioic acid hydratase in catechol pathway
MKLASLNTYWGRRAALALGDDLIDLSAAYAARLHQDGGHTMRQALRLSQLAMPAAMGDILALADGLDRARELADWIAGALQQEPERLASIHWKMGQMALAPAVPEPSKIWCMGANYVDHRREMAAKQGGPPLAERLQGFLKAPSALIGPFDDIVLPPESQHVEFEMELAYVIGRRARRVTEEQCFDYIAGYVAFNDVSARDVPLLDNRRMDRGKGFDTFAVMGPWFVTKDEVPDPHNVSIKLRLNGELMQDGNTRDLMKDIPYQMAWLTAAMTLEPGDVISTGSPSGTRPMKPGDVIEGEVEGVGHIRNRIVADPAPPSAYGVPQIPSPTTVGEG